jgi:hypothetical protein
VQNKLGQARETRINKNISLKILVYVLKSIIKTNFECPFNMDLKDKNCVVSFILWTPLNKKAVKLLEQNLSILHRV